MYGISATTGRKLGGIDHLRQSIRDILTTPIGSRVMRREYGSRLFDLIDAPFSSSVKLDIIAATAEAIMTWEPRVLVESVSLSSFESGKIIIDLAGKYLPDGRDVRLEGIVIE
ncbi:GPW/gp25 family protein [Ruegeria marisrubri]|uniref:GPW/gp25 family protein n=1 Tax=Ruegeria marisrubri TaxID=1685379 RepID=UPI001CD541A1|nr:GPW/gp25 family protein [Ruegeria marisrubri]MCA0905135.1 GPW/gp25 family protein [Ruegeria marisrubri]